MASTQQTPWQWPVPRPLQHLFDRFPLVTYGAAELPARSESATSDDLPTLYIFTSEEDARLGSPSFNPGCLKWQTYLRLSSLPFRTLPSTNHASPTGSLPFLLPPRTSQHPSPLPIPASSLTAYAHTNSPSPPLREPSSALSEAYHSLLSHPLRNAWLYALYLDPTNTHLLDQFYVLPASSSPWIQDALRKQLRRAAEEEILKTGSYVSGAAAGTAVVDGGRVYEEAREALEALAGGLAGSETGWFFGGRKAGGVDVGVFAYTELMVRWMSDEGEGEGDGKGGKRVMLGEMVKRAGNGELEEHRKRVLEAVGWGDGGEKR